MENIERCGAKIIKAPTFDARTDIVHSWIKHDFVSMDIINTLLHTEESYLVDQIIRSTLETHRQAIREIFVIVKMSYVLFGTLCLLIFFNCRAPTFIWDPTFIRDTKVIQHRRNGKNIIMILNNFHQK